MVTWPQYAGAFRYRDDVVGILDAQTDLGVPKTGEWDGPTERAAARAPRCGCLDVQNLGESRWGLQEVAWFVQSYPGGVSDEVARAIFVKAFASWSAVCGLSFRYAAGASNANILIGGGRGQRSNFDGPSGTLAWAYLPSGKNFTGQVKVMFDLDESWTADKNANGILLLNVAAHEFGHAIGLSHNNVAKQLLNPIYNRGIATPQSFDASQVAQLYGPPKTTPAPTPTPGNPAAVNAVKVQLADGRVYGASTTQVLTELPAQLTENSEEF